MNETPLQNTSHVLSKDGTRIGYLSVGEGPSVLVIPGVLSKAADYAAFARALSEHFSVHTIERTSSGRVAARRALGAPDSKMPVRTGRTAPTASRTTKRSETRVSRLGSATFLLDRPMPVGRGG